MTYCLKLSIVQMCWKEYVATIPVHATRYCARPEIGIENGALSNSDTIARATYELVASLREIGPDAKAAGQPIAQVEYSVTRKSKRHEVDLTKELPVLFFKTNQKGEKVGLLMYAYQNDTAENFSKRYSEKAVNAEEWYPLKLYDSAVVAVNVDSNGRLFDKSDANQGFDAPSKRHPCLVMSFAKNANGESEVQLIADHYVLDGMLLNAIINAPTSETKQSIGWRKRLIGHHIFKEKQKTHVNARVESEDYNGVCISEVQTQINPPAELSAWSAAFFYQAMIETMQEQKAKPWNNLTKSLGLNVTFSKHELEPLSVGGVGLQDTSIYRTNTWEYNHRHIIGMINSMYKFKVDKDICEGKDPFDTTTQVTRALATVTRSNVPDTLAKVLNEVVRHDGMESVRAVLAFPPTCIIEDIGNSTQHETVVGRDLPNIVIQRGVDMMRYTLSVDETSRFVSREQLPVVTELMAIYATELTSAGKAATSADAKSLKESNDKIEEIKQRIKTDIRNKLITKAGV